MGILLSIIGMIVTAAGLLAGFGTTALSAPQQAVQGIYLVIGVLGLVIIGAGAIVHGLQQNVDVLGEIRDRNTKTGEPTVAPETSSFEYLG